MKNISHGAGVLFATLTLLAASQASAAVIFSDNFDSAADNAVVAQKFAEAHQEIASTRDVRGPGFECRMTRASPLKL